MHLLLLGPLPTNSSYPGGPQISFFYLLDELKKKRDIELTVIDTMANNRIERSLSVIKWTLKMLLTGSKADVISLHASTNTTLFFGPVVWFVSRIYKKKFALRVFGGSIGKVYFNQNIVFQWFIRKTIFSADIVFLQTKELVSSLSKQISGHVAWYPTNRPTYKRIEKKNLSSNKIDFIFLGHVKPSKGIKELVSAVKMLEVSNYIGVHIYGPLLEGIPINLFEKSVVEYKGVLSPEKVSETLKNYDVLILPTYYKGEGYPGVIIEAYSVGIPVITTKWMNIPEIVDDTCGILIEPKNVSQLAEAMDNLSRDPNKVEELKRGAKRKAEQFSSEKLAVKFLSECKKTFS